MSDTRLESIKVVAVDDNGDSRELLKYILGRSCADAVIVGSGQEALTTMKDVHPDILISDLGMPEMDGYELLKNVRRLDPEVGSLPVIAFTAAARHEDRALTRRAGFQAHIAKPVDADELVTKILELVEG
jgi:CheY-like chemotaxis protein